MSLLRPLRLGKVTLPNNLVLSPMAGYTDKPFRALCKAHGAGLVCTEMVAAVSYEHDARATHRRAETTAGERPVSIQIVGNDPVWVGRAASHLGERCDVLGINFGCPAHQVAKAGCGAALLDHPDRAIALVEAIKANSDAPLLVKMRAGTRGVMDCAAFARRLERAGADGLIFHARTAAQSYRGLADWDLIRSVKEAISIPVVGNGDVRDGPTAQRALERSGCDGLAIGRAALGDPRVFARVAAWLERGEALPPPTPAERLADFRGYVEGLAGYDVNLAHAVPHAHAFSKGLPGAAALRARLAGARSAEELLARFEAHLASPGMPAAAAEA